MPAHAETRQELIYKIASSYQVNPELAIAITDCEGQAYKRIGNNHNKNGTIDIGYFQVNSIHLQEAQGMGLNLYNDRENIIYGIWLMSIHGTRDWRASQRCWSRLV